MSIADKLKHAVFTDEDDAPAKTGGKRAPIIGQVAAPVVQNVSDVVAPDVYQAIRDGSQFESTDSYNLIQRFMAPLSSIPDSAMSPALKVKTAMLQAAAQSSVSAESILGEFDKIETELKCMADAFDSQCKQFNVAEVEHRNQRLTEIGAQIKALQEEQQKLSTEVLQATQHLQQNETNFATAIQRRRMELANQKAQYETYLKG
jgi:DNA repair exonuclease SbcCD ATPase subunit